jgi:predicted double-glycine peptidase
MNTFDFPELKQICNYDCGACALESVFMYYGKNVFEEDIIKIAQTIPKSGTSIRGMLKAIKHFGFDGELKELSVIELKKYIDKKIPVILRLQAWSQHENTNWIKDWKDGHYVVVIGYDKEKFYFEDPWVLNRTYLKFGELMERWHDVDIDDKKYVNCGIVVHGHRKNYDIVKVVHMK